MWTSENWTTTKFQYIYYSFVSVVAMEWDAWLLFAFVIESGFFILWDGLWFIIFEHTVTAIHIQEWPEYYSIFIRSTQKSSDFFRNCHTKLYVQFCSKQFR